MLAQAPRRPAGAHCGPLMMLWGPPGPSPLVQIRTTATEDWILRGPYSSPFVDKSLENLGIELPDLVPNNLILAKIRILLYFREGSDFA